MSKVRSIQIAQNLRTARRSARYTQSQAADILGVARTTLVAIEAGERSVKADELQQMAELYHCDLDALLNEPAGLPDSAKVQRYENYFLSMLLRGHLTEGGAAELMSTGILQIRERMIDRYGDDWRDASDDEQDLWERMVKAGDYDELLAALNWSRTQAAAHKLSKIKYHLDR